MGIRNKILVYFSLTIILLTGVSFTFIYTLFGEYREEKFQQRQKEKIMSTLYFLSEIKRYDRELSEAIDRLTINDIYNEKLLIFNRDKELIYSSIDDMPIPYSREILNYLSPEKEWHESKQDLYDVVGLYFENEGNAYYGISKAYDTFGYSKLNYLKLVLIIAFLIISVVVTWVSYFLASRITSPLVDLASKIGNYDFDAEHESIKLKQPEAEISVLAEQFNRLMSRMNSAFSFQKHAIHHISHELKTPISILVSNFEKMENENDIDQLHVLIRDQKEATRSLGEMINSLLEIAKAEAGNAIMQEQIRVDELIFDIAQELKVIYPDYLFSIDYYESFTDSSLTVTGNTRLLKAALSNLMLNCIHYSLSNSAAIKIGGNDTDVFIEFSNDGEVITEDELKYLFKYFFRGANSSGRSGFGLGLVFVHRIIALHRGNVSYSSYKDTTNQFRVQLPLS